MGQGALATLTHRDNMFQYDRLVGPRGYMESLGFPLVIWEGGNTYDGMFVDYANLGWNLLFAVGVGSVIGFFVARRTNFLNRLIQQLQSESVDRQPFLSQVRHRSRVTEERS